MDIIMILKIIGMAIGAGTIIFLFIRSIYFFNEKRKKKKEVRDAAENRIRYESLDQMILNDRQRKTERGNYQNPYDISYEQGSALKQEKEAKPLMISLVEKNKLSTKKYVFSLENPIKIGASVKGNDVIVQGDGIADCQCIIFSDGRSIYVKNQSGISKTVLSRKKDKAVVDKNGLKLQSGDKIVIGQITYEITIVD